MEKSVKCSSEFSSPEASKSEEFHARGDFFDIQSLPNEIIVHIFKFLDLSSWKNGRQVCSKWDELLCFVALFSRFALSIKGDISNCCQVICQTKSFFPLVKITGSSMGMDLMKILDKIGKGVVEISIDLNGYALEHLNLPSNFLSKFSKARILNGNPFLFRRVDIPDTVETINLINVRNFMDRVVVEKLLKFNKESSKKIVVQGRVGIVDEPEENDMELIKVDKVATKIAKSIGNVEIQLMNNLKGILEIDLSNVQKFDDGHRDNFVFVEKEDFDFYLKHIHQMPNLKVLYGIRTNTDGCFFKHVPIFNLGIETLIIWKFFHCEECAKAIRESFPNLKKFIGLFMVDLDFSTLLRFNVKFEEISIKWESYVSFEPLLQLPDEYFENLSNLAHLYIERISGSPNWKKIFKKFPQLPKLERFHLWFSEENPKFADFHGLFTKCPNIKKLNFHAFDDLNLTNLVELLKILPKLEDLELFGYISEDFDFKEFVDAIAPFSKNLYHLEIYGPNFERVLGNIFQDDEMQNLKQKIPTLKIF